MKAADARGVACLLAINGHVAFVRGSGKNLFIKRSYVDFVLAARHAVLLGSRCEDVTL